MSIYRKKYKGFAGVLFILANLIGVFGSIFCFIAADYASAKASTWWTVTGAVLAISFALFWIIGFVQSGKKTK